MADDRSIDHLKTDLGRVAKSMYTQNLALNERNRTLTILQAIDSIALDFNRDLKQLGSDISKAITESSKFSMVGIFSHNSFDSTGMSFQGMAVDELQDPKIESSGIIPNLVRLRIDNEGKWSSSDNRYLMIDFNSSASMSQFDSEGENMQEIFQILKRDFGLSSLYATKLRVGEKNIGLLVVGMEETMPHIDDIELIERIAGPVGIALFNRVLFDENQKTLFQLQQSNAKLKEIDETKDEFIGMASHQLRTPLTSMKGYLSMVLDGDYGDISPEQRDVLKRSYSSAQRMVYLIADLLNVSRLRTGKFVIINKPTDLGELVDEELNQLYDLAKSKNIQITYDKSENIPKLMLDATKLRQVVMNFLDNAVYYTPNDGKIEVRLLTNDKFVEFSVKDNGMGVPETEQQNLFNKFYRASNAKKSRPDGTGLGLYMAGKVISAQGGSVVFQSREGEGSIFGFRFPLER